MEKLIQAAQAAGFSLSEEAAADAAKAAAEILAQATEAKATADAKTAEVETLTAEKADQAATITAQLQTIEELNAALATSEKQVAKTGPVVKVKGKDYQVVHGVQTAQGPHTVKEIATNTELAAKLVKAGSGALVEVPTS